MGSALSGEVMAVSPFVGRGRLIRQHPSWRVQESPRVFLPAFVPNATCEVVNFLHKGRRGSFERACGLPWVDYAATIDVTIGGPVGTEGAMWRCWDSKV